MSSGFDVVFGNTAVDRRLLTDEQLQKALASGQPLPEVLVQQGILSSDQRDTLLDLFETQLSADAIPGYRLRHVVGKGAMGSVFRATDTAANRDVAVKVLSPVLARDKSMTKRFLREFESMQRLDHPAVVRCLGSGEANGIWYLVMEFIEGETLLERIRKSPLSEPEALDLLEKMASALDHAHSLGLIHRDVKPANILMGPPSLASGELRRDAAKLADFGLARDQVAPALTGSVGFLGTPYYCSPEQAEGDRALDIRSDLYSLGATIYHAVTGSVPFEGETALSIAVKHVGREAPSARDRGAKIDAPFEALIRKLMMKDPANRPQTPAELLADIAAVRAGRLPSRLYRRRWPSAVATLVILLATVGMVFALTPKPPPPWTRGVVEKLPDGRWKTVYDFATADQVLDWKPIRPTDIAWLGPGKFEPPFFSAFWHVERWDGDVEVEITAVATELRILMALNPGGTPDVRAIVGKEFKMQVAGQARQITTARIPGFNGGDRAVIKFVRQGKTLDFFYNGVLIDNAGKMPAGLPVSDRLYFGLEGPAAIRDPKGPAPAPSCRIERVTITGNRRERPTP